MDEHFKLTSQEFCDNAGLFGALETKAQQVMSKNYQDLSKFLKKQYGKLILINHPEKGGDEKRFNRIHKALSRAEKYISRL